MADERSRSPRRDFVWVKVKDGNPVRIMLSQLADPKDVFNLLEAVKTKESPKLDTVAIGDLQLFQNEGAKANGERCLRPGLLIGEVNGGNKDDNPLYIFFHGAGSGEASQALVGQSLFFCDTFLVPGVSFRIIFRVKPSDSHSLLLCCWLCPCPWLQLD